MIAKQLQDDNTVYIPDGTELEGEAGVIEIGRWTVERALKAWCDWDCAGDVRGSVYPARHSNQATDGVPDTRVALFIAREIERFASGSMRMCPIRDMIRYRIWMKRLDWEGFRWTTNPDHDTIMRRVMAWQGETLSDLADRVWQDLTAYLEKRMREKERI